METDDNNLFVLVLFDFFVIEFKMVYFVMFKVFSIYIYTLNHFICSRIRQSSNYKRPISIIPLR